MVNELLGMVEQGLPDAHVGRPFGMTPHQVRYLRRQLGIPSSFSKLSTAPEDFPTIACARPLNETARHYGVAWKTARRWAHEHGVEPKRHIPMRNALRRQRGRVEAIQQAPDLAERAAIFLRRFSPVYRCDIQLFVGKPDTLGTQMGLSRNGRGWWMIRGKGPVEAEDLIALAEAKGFKP